MNTCTYLGDKDSEGQKTCLCNMIKRSTCPYPDRDLEHSRVHDGLMYCDGFEADKRRED